MCSAPSSHVSMAVKAAVLKRKTYSRLLITQDSLHLFTNGTSGSVLFRETVSLTDDLPTGSPSFEMQHSRGSRMRSPQHSLFLFEQSLPPYRLEFVSVNYKCVKASHYRALHQSSEARLQRQLSFLLDPERL